MLGVATSGVPGGQATTKGTEDTKEEGRDEDEHRFGFRSDFAAAGHVARKIVVLAPLVGRRPRDAVPQRPARVAHDNLGTGCTSTFFCRGRAGVKYAKKTEKERTKKAV